MDYTTRSCREFVTVLASNEPAPGGGGASALVAALGTALGNMVGSLTVGKKKYADVEAEIIALKETCDKLQTELLDQVPADAEGFIPLSKAYGIPKDDPTRDEVMENALRVACGVPMDIMRVLGRAIEIHKRMSEIGSAIAISDVGVGVICCKTAMQGASLNVFINTKTMKDRDYALALEKEADELLDKYCAMADETYKAVYDRLRG